MRSSAGCGSCPSAAPLPTDGRAVLVYDKRAARYTKELLQTVLKVSRDGLCHFISDLSQDFRDEKDILRALCDEARSRLAPDEVACQDGWPIGVRDFAWRYGKGCTLI